MYVCMYVKFARGRRPSTRCVVTYFYVCTVILCVTIKSACKIHRQSSLVFCSNRGQGPISFAAMEIPGVLQPNIAEFEEKKILPNLTRAKNNLQKKFPQVSQDSNTRHSRLFPPPDGPLLVAF
jgi:hypothetical protein